MKLNLTSSPFPCITFVEILSKYPSNINILTISGNVKYISQDRKMFALKQQQKQHFHQITKFVMV